MAKVDLKSLVSELRNEGEKVLATKYSVTNPYMELVELRSYETWRAGCLNLLHILGDLAAHWAEAFTSQMHYAAAAMRMAATLDAMDAAMNHGLLVRVREIVFAEAFDNILEQADHLHAQGYYLAAGVLGRAVLEEHLRNWCGTAGCTPTKAKPTLNDFKAELQKAAHLTVTQAKHVDAMAGVGNDAAHNKATLKSDDVERLLRDVREFIGKYP